jgi:hypothetical protein
LVELFIDAVYTAVIGEMAFLIILLPIHCQFIFDSLESRELACETASHC